MYKQSRLKKKNTNLKSLDLYKYYYGNRICRDHNSFSLLEIDRLPEFYEFKFLKTYFFFFFLVVCLLLF